MRIEPFKRGKPVLDDARYWQAYDAGMRDAKLILAAAYIAAGISIGIVLTLLVTGWFQ